MPMRMPKFRFTRRVGKILLSIVAVALLLCGVAAWQVPKVLRSVLTEDVSKMLGRDVSVGKISFNPFTLTVRARDLAIAQPGSETPLLTLAELDASAAWSSLFWFAPVVDRLTLREPKIAIVREDVTRFNFSDVQQRVAEMSAAKPRNRPSPTKARRASRSTTCASRAARSRWTTRSPAASRWWTSSRWACRSSPPSAMPPTSTCSPGCTCASTAAPST